MLTILPMSRFLLIAILLVSLNSNAQSVFGYWYGYANVKTPGAANNYLVELILNPEKGYVSGVLNYYFRNTYRSLKVQGNYDVRTRTLSMYDIPLTYHASTAKMEVDCMMNMRGMLRISKTDSLLIGTFNSLPKYKYTCPEVSYSLTFNADISKKDSVLNAIRNFKETNQLWQPSAFDTLPAVAVIPRKVVNYVLNQQMPERQIEIAQELEVESDTIEVDFYDNGEVDGDSIAVFFNKQLVAYNLKLSSRSIHFTFTLDKTNESNELIMFAENLGSIPPNTALMVVDDGKNKHQIRLSSSLEKNAGIKIRRKR